MNSSVMKLEFGNFSMLFTGDIESDTEERLVKLHKDEIRSTILKAPHHGGEFSSTLPFLQAVGAKAVVISVGAGNSFNHPHEDTLAKYRQLKSKIYRTDLAGHLHIISDGKTWSIKQQFPKGKDAPTKAEKESHKPKPTSKINVNTADIPTLASIPLVGIRTAEKIHALRTEKGNFETLEGLTKVRGIGKKLLSRIRPYITISDEEESVTEMK
jgi:competence ComEA-like helix-hairpin-helix protein